MPVDPSRPPLAEQDPRTLQFAVDYAPILLADEREPFYPISVGYTVFEQEMESPSFLPPRRVEWEGVGYPAFRAIEFALWWDWDIDHLYELEHVWTFVGAGGEVCAVEASWHGMFGPIDVAGQIRAEGTHPVLLVQPGKHAMAGEPRAFEEIREWAEQEAGPEAGKDGVLENDLFRGQLLKTPENDSKVKDYLRRLAFTPSWRFTRRFEITRDMLVPWPALREWIPQRVAWWLTRI